MMHQVFANVYHWLNQERRAWWVLIGIALFFAFFHIHSPSVRDWDEARQGVNALQMLRTGDYVNLYYEDGELDTWNAKPPLLIWAIAGSFTLFGETVWAMRLPSVMCGILYLLVSYKIIRMYRSPFFALAVTVGLLCCKALYWDHVAMTADFDGMLLFFLQLSLYGFLLRIEQDRSWGIWLCMLGIGLAFYTKGPAAFVLVPGMLLYTVYKKKMVTLIKDWRTYAAGTGVLLCMLSWIGLIAVYGIKFKDRGVYKTDNSLKIMFYHDVLGRFTSTTKAAKGVVFEDDYNYFIVPEVLDARLNVWNYCLYAVLLYFIYQGIQRWRTSKSFWNFEHEDFMVMSMCMALPLSVFLSLASNVNNWYLAPVFIFYLIITMDGLFRWAMQWKPLIYLMVCLFVFTGVRHWLEIGYAAPDATEQWVEENKQQIRQAHAVFVEVPTQSLFLYLKLNNRKVTTIYPKDELKNLPLNAPNTLYISKEGESYLIK